ncbi:MAG: ATP-dependent zinc metalloprotease FtsH [Gammaproteobacteria bacterium]|nr:ATP-dependent zinc metalloprotease FtsH [Gammaproteobacteria bacterium]
MPDTTQPPAAKDPNSQHWLTIALLLFGFYYLMQVFVSKPAQVISYSEFLQQVNNAAIAEVVLKGNEIHGRYRKSDANANFDFRVIAPNFENARLLDILEANDVNIKVQADELPFWARMIAGFLPWLLILAFFFWTSRALQSRMGASGGGLMGFSSSRARRFEPTTSGPRYEDIAGLESAKQDFQEIIDYLKNPQKYRDMGAHMPKGILMMGAPGTGKTLLAKATANEAEVPFFSVSGSEFIEMFVGVGASRVRDMFNQARKVAPALIFIDEIDSVGRVRGTGLGGGNDEREQTLNQILAEMDGFDPEEAVVVLAATNRPDVLDPALMRPGRFDRKITLELPQRKARAEILQVHSRHTPLAEDVQLDQIAAVTPGFSGADLANLVNEAALNATRDNRTSIRQEDFLSARDKVIMGTPRTDLLNPSERKRIACHEAGHAITAYFSSHSDPVQKISIVPRGQALGMTEQLPEEDRHNLNEDYLLDRLSVLLGGRCAEKLVFGNVSTGAADDLKQATRLGYKMVGQWGMGKNIGPIGYSIAEEHPFLGRELAEPKEFSEQTAHLLDEEVRLLLREAEQQTIRLLSEHSQHLQSLLQALLEKETLQHDEIVALLGH